MKKILTALSFVVSIFLLQLSACKVDPSFHKKIVPNEPVRFYTPEGWPAPVYTFAGNQLTQDGFELGRRLFYDTRLSRDNSTSCASCHQQFAAFSMLDHPQSHGIEGKFGPRNAPGLFNIAWFPAYFWDGNEPSLDNFPIHPINNPVEMDEQVGNIIAKLSADASYRSYFEKAFGDGSISQDRIFKALALFQAALISANSKYDKYIRGENGGNLTEQESNGLKLFREKCEACHKEPLFTDFSYRNNGLRPSSVFNDSGRAIVTKLSDDLYKFKVPSLRNVALSRPYTHDGRFYTLEEVLEHYRTGIYTTATLDTSLRSGISMTDQEKKDIISFLQTLSDNEFVKDPRFSAPSN